ncbi:MAG: DUF370 domain-containing protein [Oscillospiraceae bacterium]|jgi:regulator of extracellular matrix RemA (YlzA/DUF370 family)|nr:DUF370 domain-containing protein [Oscillospiraceae bacterium]
MTLINIGFGSMISAEKVVAMISPESAPVKRLVTEAREGAQLIDATYGRRTRAVIVAESGHVILSALQPETIAARFPSEQEGAEDKKSARAVWREEGDSDA